MDTVLSSRSREVIVSIDRPFVIIGERINPTGRKVLAAEMKEGKMDRVRSDAIAQADVLCSFSSIAMQRNYTRPQFADESLIEIVAGRHAVVEAQIESFVPNDCRLSPARRG